MRSVEEDTHGKTTDETGDGNSHDPAEDEEPDTLEVDSLESSVAKTDTDSGAGDTHRGRDGELSHGLALSISKNDRDNILPCTG